MIQKVLYFIARCFRNAFVIGAGLLAFALFMFMNRSSFFDKTTLDDAQVNLKAILESDPNAKKIYEEHQDKKERDAMMIASQSAGNNAETRSILRQMATEMNETGEMPYRARLAELAISERKFSSEQEQEEFLYAYGTVLQSLLHIADYDGGNQWLDWLEVATNDPVIWPLVKDDPLCLFFWRQTDDTQLVDFYHRNREWLGEPLSLIVEDQQDDTNLDDEQISENWKGLLSKLAEHEAILREVIEEGGLGVFGIQQIISHGSLIELCVKEYHLDPTETACVTYFNPEILLPEKLSRDPVDIHRERSDLAALLNQIHKKYFSVWMAATETPFALTLYRNVGGKIANRLLSKYGPDTISIVIYSHFEPGDPAISFAAKSVDKFGDLAIYVLQKHQGDEFSRELKAAFLNPKIGLRTIPFVLKFDNAAWEKMRSDPRWADRYFTADGELKVDKWEWVGDLPGGAIVQVGRNWAKGYPCTYGELGWAAFDVADAALLIASFGSSTAVTAGVKATAKQTGKSLAARAAEGIGTMGRKINQELWSPFIKGATKRVPRLAKMAKVASDIAAKVANLTKISILKGWSVTAISYDKAKLAVNNWRALKPTTRRAVYRGLLATTLFISVTQRTIPNGDKIARGIGQLIGDAAAGTINFVGKALSAAILQFNRQMTGLTQAIVFWATFIFVVVASCFFLLLGFAQKRKGRVYGSG